MVFSSTYFIIVVHVFILNDKLPVLVVGIDSFFCFLRKVNVEWLMGMGFM